MSFISLIYYLMEEDHHKTLLWEKKVIKSGKEAVL